MKYMKKITAWILALTMVLGMTIPAGAAEAGQPEFTVALEDVEGAAGGIIKMNLVVSNNPGFDSMSVRVYYKTSVETEAGTQENVLTCTQAIKGSGWSEFSNSFDAANGVRPIDPQINKNDISTIPDDRKEAGWSMASLGFITGTYDDPNDGETKVIKCEQDGVFATLTFKVVDGAESFVSDIEVEVASVSFDDVPCETPKTVNGKITVTGTPTLNKVVLDEEDENGDATVEVAGVDAKDVELPAGAVSNWGADITDQVTWTIVPNEGEGEAPANEVSIGKTTGLITVSNVAKEWTYTPTLANQRKSAGGIL